MYRIKLKRNSTDDFDEILTINKKDKAHFEYQQSMNGEYFFGELVEVINGKEKNISSFCKSEFAECEKITQERKERLKKSIENANKIKTV